MKELKRGQLEFVSLSENVQNCASYGETSIISSAQNRFSQISDNISSLQRRCEVVQARLEKALSSASIKPYATQLRPVSMATKKCVTRKLENFHLIKSSHVVLG